MKKNSQNKDYSYNQNRVNEAINATTVASLDIMYGRNCYKQKGWLNRFSRPKINHIYIDSDSSGLYCVIADIVDPNYSY